MQKRHFLAKDKACGIENCSRKYSSKIALRAHIKLKHGSKKA